MNRNIRRERLEDWSQGKNMKEKYVIMDIERKLRKISEIMLKKSVPKDI